MNVPFQDIEKPVELLWMPSQLLDAYRFNGLCCGSDNGSSLGRHRSFGGPVYPALGLEYAGLGTGGCNYGWKSCLSTKEMLHSRPCSSGTQMSATPKSPAISRKRRRPAFRRHSWHSLCPPASHCLLSASQKTERRTRAHEREKDSYSVHSNAVCSAFAATDKAALDQRLDNAKSGGRSDHADARQKHSRRG